MCVPISLSVHIESSDLHRSTPMREHRVHREFVYVVSIHMCVCVYINYLRLYVYVSCVCVFATACTYVCVCTCYLYETLPRAVADRCLQQTRGLKDTSAPRRECNEHRTGIQYLCTLTDKSCRDFFTAAGFFQRCLLRDLATNRCFLPVFPC